MRALQIKRVNREQKTWQKAAYVYIENVEKLSLSPYLYNDSTGLRIERRV